MKIDYKHDAQQLRIALQNTVPALARLLEIEFTAENYAVISDAKMALMQTEHMVGDGMLDDLLRGRKGKP